jgi:glutamyl endopeptidase
LGSSVAGWVTSGSEQYDYGAIKLDCSIGNRTGWYGYFWQAATLVGTAMTTQGYPGDKPLTQWKSSDRIRANSSRQVFYQADTVGGQSGSPVWAYRKNTTGCNKRPCAMAIHAYGVHGTGAHSTNNHGTRINQEVFNNLTSWKNAL